MNKSDFDSNIELLAKFLPIKYKTSICTIEINNCHTRSNLGISAMLDILQSCKLDHEMVIISDRPPTHC